MRQLTDRGYFNERFLEYLKGGDYNVFYSRLKTRFAKLDGAAFEKTMSLLKSSKSEAAKIYAFHPEFYDVFINRHGPKADAECGKLLRKKGVDFWD